MKRLAILAVGRQKEADLSAACHDYYRRCSHRFRIEERELKDLKQLTKQLPARGPHLLIALDERGKQHTSRAFAALLESWLQQVDQLTFIIGGADGLNDELRQRAHHLLSLGKMTIAHRLARLLLAEQLYRAVSILDGSPYHRG